jgi:flagellar motor switch protein FliM
MADILSQKEINALLDVIEEIPEKNLNNNNFEKNLNNNILFLKNILKDEELVISKSQL